MLIQNIASSVTTSSNHCCKGEVHWLILDFMLVVPYTFNIPFYDPDSIAWNVTIIVGNTRECFNVTIIDDTVEEVTEIFTFHITGVIPDNIDVFRGTTEISILDNDGTCIYNTAVCTPSVIYTCKGQ